MVRVRRALRFRIGRLAGIAALAVAFAVTADVGNAAPAKQPPGKASVAKNSPAKSKQAAAKKAALKKVALKKSAAKQVAAKKAAAKNLAAKKMTPAQRKRAIALAKAKEKARVARIIRAAGPAPPIKKQYDGVASFYTGRQRTASGGRYNPGAMTAAHRSLPFGTKVKVIDKRSGRGVTVTINDRGPFKRGRVIDLSRAAARALGMSHRGVTRVRVTVLENRVARR